MSVINQIDIFRYQVQVDAIIVELSEEKSAQLGVTWLSAGDNEDEVLGLTNFTNAGGGVIGLAGAASGVAVMANGREAGVLGQVIGGTGVALIRLDRIEDPSAVTVDDTPATLTLPPWATYRFGESVAAE